MPLTRVLQKLFEISVSSLKKYKYSNQNNIQMFLKTLRDTQKSLRKSLINHQKAPLNEFPKTFQTSLKKSIKIFPIRLPELFKHI